MIIKHNWFRTTIKDRLTNRLAPFDISFHPYQEYFSRNLDTAAINTAKELEKIHNRIFLALSGGLDSSYVFKMLVEAKVRFTPIIVMFRNTINWMEVTNAFKLCRDAAIEPVILRTTERELLRIYGEKILLPYNGFGDYFGLKYLACQYAMEHDGLIICGDHFLVEKDGVNPNGMEQLGVFEYDFYHDLLFDSNRVCDFFMYSQDIAYQHVKDGDKYQNSNELQKALYNDPRDIPENDWDNAFIKAIADGMRKQLVPTQTFVLLDRRKFIDIIRPL